MRRWRALGGGALGLALAAACLAPVGSAAGRLEAMVKDEGGRPLADVVASLMAPGVVVLGCNIHDWMVGYVYVSATPYFATTGGADPGRLEFVVALKPDRRAPSPRPGYEKPQS